MLLPFFLFCQTSKSKPSIWICGGLEFRSRTAIPVAITMTTFIFSLYLILDISKFLVLVLVLVDQIVTNVLAYSNIAHTGISYIAYNI